MHMNDNELIRQYITGDQGAFEIIIHRYTKVLYRFIYPILKDVHATNDCIQEVFIKVWKNIKKYNQNQSFKNWIFTIAHRTALDIIKKKKNIPFSVLDSENSIFEENIPDEELLPDAIFENEENVKLVKKALENLPPSIQIIILLHNGENMTFEEISTITNTSINTVKSRYRRALIKLKNDIAPKL